MIQIDLELKDLKWMKKLANGTASRPPYGDACAYLADLYDKGGLGLLLDRGKAFNYWFLGSKQSHPYCSFRVAKAYESGVELNETIAKRCSSIAKPQRLETQMQCTDWELFCCTDFWDVLAMTVML